jgi:hypothetical protein
MDQMRVVRPLKRRPPGEHGRAVRARTSGHKLIEQVSRQRRRPEVVEIKILSETLAE